MLRYLKSPEKEQLHWPYSDLFVDQNYSSPNLVKETGSSLGSSLAAKDQNHVLAWITFNLPWFRGYLPLAAKKFWIRLESQWIYFSPVLFILETKERNPNSIKTLYSKTYTHSKFCSV